MADKPTTKPAGRPSGADGGGPPHGRRARRPGGKRFYRRRKVDYFSVNRIDHIDYKDVDTLTQFVGDRGKISPRRHTGLSARHQRELRRAIKRARNLALLPFAGPVDKKRPGKTGGRPRGGPPRGGPPRGGPPRGGPPRA